MKRPDRNASIARVLVELTVLIVVAGAIAGLLWLGKGWQGSFVGEGAGAKPPLRTLAGPRRVRSPTVAGQFYPTSPAALHAEVARRLADAPKVGLRGVRAVLVPHAGYAFSGNVAAAAFREVSPDFRLVFILASNHNGAARFSGVSLPEYTHYGIPGAEIPLSAVVEDLRHDELFTSEPAAHTMHMIEVELPFLQALHGQAGRGEYAIVPMIVGRMDADGIDHLVEVLDSHADRKTLFVFSVDLSHYHPAETARRLDTYTVDAIMGLDRGALARAQTDGNQVLQTLVALARRRGWEPTLLLTRNSGDASGETGRVVGYAAIAFHDPLAFTERERRDLLTFARHSIEDHLREGRAPEPERDWLDRHPIFRIPRAVFVTIEKDGRLRGCIGDLVSRKPLYAGVRSNAVRAAVSDPRFPPVTAEELGDLSITISVLGFPARVQATSPEEYLDLLRPLRDGVILVHNGRRSTFLPQVWRDLPDPEQFLSRLALKQGLPADAWRSPSTVLYRYGAYVFGEDSLSPELAESSAWSWLRLPW